MAEKGGVYYAFSWPTGLAKEGVIHQPPGTKVTIIIDSDNILWIDRNWPTEASVGIPVQELEDVIAEYRKHFPERSKNVQPIPVTDSGQTPESSSGL